MRHGEMLAPGIERVLTEAGVAATDLTEIAVGSGRGRSPDCASGWSPRARWRSSAACRCTASARSTSWRPRRSTTGSTEFAVATDARRKEVYFASYAGGRRVSGPEVLKPGDPIDARGRRPGCPALPRHVPEPQRPASIPSAAVLCDVVHRGRFELLAPDPLYLRRPDAVEPGKPKRVS